MFSALARIVAARRRAEGEGPCCRDRDLAGTCSSRRHIRRLCLAAPAGHRSTGQDSPAGHCTASDHRTFSDRRTASGPRTGVGLRTASCRRMASGRQTAVDPGRETGPGSGRPVVGGSRWVGELQQASLWGPTGISGLMSNPDLDIVGPRDTADPEAGMPSRAPGRRLGLLGAIAFDPHSQEEADSAYPRDSLVGVQLVLSGIRLPFCKWARRSVG